MAAAGKSPRDMAQYVFDAQGCKGCHTAGRDGKLGFTAKGKRMAQGFEGCVNLLTKMSVVAHAKQEARTPQQRQTAARFNEFGCTFCHHVDPGKLSLTQVGSKLAHLHLGCVDVQKLVAGAPTPKR